MLDLVLFIIFLYFLSDCICYICYRQENDDDIDNSRQLTTVVVINNDENKPEEDLPPYTPPTPKTQAAMADLPPSYNESLDITETNNYANYAVNNNGANVNNNIYMPATCVVNPYTPNNNVNNVNLPASYIINPNNPFITANNENIPTNNSYNPFIANTNNNINMPTTYVLNPNVTAVPEIEVNPSNTPTTTTTPATTTVA